MERVWWRSEYLNGTNDPSLSNTSEWWCPIRGVQSQISTTTTLSSSGTRLEDWPILSSFVRAYLYLNSSPYCYPYITEMAALLSRKQLDEDRLAELGYSQELRRDWSMLHNFGVSFSIIVRSAYLSTGFLSATLSKDCFAFSSNWSDILTAFVLQERGDWDNDVHISCQERRSCWCMCTDRACASLFQYGLNTGGPGVMSVGWIIISFFSMFVSKTKLAAFDTYHVNWLLAALFVGLGMAEIVSAIPTSGGPYFWSAILAPPGNKALASWVTGWQVALNMGEIPADEGRQSSYRTGSISWAKWQWRQELLLGWRIWSR